MEVSFISLVLHIALFVIGLLVLVKGSDWFVESAAHIAHHFNVPEVIIGLTLVSIGTSLPELATNIVAANSGNPEIALGNVTGSNIANVLLVLGVSVVFMRRLPIDRILFSRDTMVMAAAFALFLVMAYLMPVANPTITRWEGLLLLLFFGVYMFFLFRRKDPIKEEVKPIAETRLARRSSLPKSSLLLVVGGVMTVVGAKLMVDNVVWGAGQFGMSEGLISATVVAFGTSVPELAVTISGILKKKSDIALGNVIGSNIFNLVFVMGVTSTIEPIPISSEAAWFILPSMAATGLVLVILMRTGWALVRWEGVLLVLGYAAFIGVNVYRCF